MGLENETRRILTLWRYVEDKGGLHFCVTGEGLLSRLTCINRTFFIYLATK